MWSRVSCTRAKKRFRAVEELPGAAVLAVDPASGQRDVVEAMVFDVVNPPVFGTADIWSPDADMTAGILEQFEVGTTYTIPGPAVAKRDQFVDFAGADASKVSYKLAFEPSCCEANSAFCEAKSALSDSIAAECAFSLAAIVSACC